jgi:Na+/H+ antiporter NhaA
MSTPSALRPRERAEAVGSLFLMRATVPTHEQSRAQRRDVLEQLSSTLGRFLRTESASAGMLLVAALVALVWSNSGWSHEYFRLLDTNVSVHAGSVSIAMDLQHWVNDGLMALFFFVIGLEVRREIAMGELSDRQRVAVPIAAGIGGMIVPIVLYLAINPSGEAARGWGIVIGTDTAFLLGALALVGPAFSTQLRVFLLAVTVVDDIVAVSIIGIVYSDAINLVPLGVAAAALAVIPLLNRVGMWRASAYTIVVLVAWTATVISGVHASIAGMAAGLLVGARPPSRHEAERATRLFRAFRQSPLPGMGRTAKQGLARVVSVNERLQVILHPWVSFVIVPIFALANAGVDLRGGTLTDALRSPITWGVVLGLVVGKFIGIPIAAEATVRLGLGTLPRGVRFGHVLGGGALSGLGFTVSLLVAHLAFPTPTLTQQATVGVLLAAVLSTLTGWLTFVAQRVLSRDDADAESLSLTPSVTPGRDHIRGPAEAPLTLLEFGDYECGFCARVTGVAQEVRERFGNQLQYVFRHLPLGGVHPNAELAAVAAEVAGEQGRFWDMHDMMFDHQNELELEDLIGYAAAIGLDVERFVRDLDDDAIIARVRADVASAEDSGAQGVPTFFIQGRRHVGAHDAQSLMAALEAARTAEPQALIEPAS